MDAALRAALPLALAVEVIGELDYTEANLLHLTAAWGNPGVAPELWRLWLEYGEGERRAALEEAFAGLAEGVYWGGEHRAEFRTGAAPGGSWAG